MDNNIISFISNRPWLTKNSKSAPSPIIKTLPAWYREADRFFRDSNTNKYYVGDDGGKIPTWKACPAMFDIMGTGYSLNTPCDVEFIQKDEDTLIINIEDKQYKDFCTSRPPMPQFEHPEGYYKNHFAWFYDWSIKTPDGYSSILTQPFNRFELPFLNTSGIIDTDVVHLPGSLPFFIRKGWSGIIKAGTPFVQVIPFKRQDWSSELIIDDSKNMYTRSKENSKKYRVPNGGVYRNNVWTQRRYE